MIDDGRRAAREQRNAHAGHAQAASGQAPAKVDAAGGGIAAATAAAYLPGVGSGKARRSGGDHAAAVSARR